MTCKKPSSIFLLNSKLLLLLLLLYNIKKFIIISHSVNMTNSFGTLNDSFNEFNNSRLFS